MHVTAGKKNKCNTMFKTYIHDLSLFVIVYDFYPISCMFSITKPWQGNHTTRWIKTTYHYQRFFSITPLPPFTTIFFFFIKLQSFLKTSQLWCQELDTWKKCPSLTNISFSNIFLTIYERKSIKQHLKA